VWHKCGVRIVRGLLAFLGIIATMSGADWPQFLGPTRNGVYAGNDLGADWPTEGPRRAWHRKIGEGFSGPVVANGKLILFHRINNEETIDCLNARTGEPIWSLHYPSRYRDDFGFDEGPRATPAVSDGKVYTFGAEGMLHCLALDDGKKIWSVDCKKSFGARKGFFGIACSPLVEGKALLVNVGGTNGAGIVAFDKLTGKMFWKTNDDEASYSSPTAATIGGQRFAFFFTRSGLTALDPASGKTYFDFPWRPPIQASVSAATPLVISDLVFISASYNAGAVLLQIKNGQPEKRWSSEDALSNHYATSVYHDGCLYGFHGRQETGPSFRCIELKTGKVLWSHENFGAGTVTLAKDELLILTEKGELIRAPASSKEFKIKARAQVLPFEVRAHPAFANGRLYARSKDQLVCVDLKHGEGAPK
jgi:outer membrane protein assembly factor BamB